MNVTQLPTQRVRYSYSTPSMSRRGGVRLHPIKDGTAPMGEQLTMLRRRDRAGNKLRDVVDPDTGFCVGVTSPLEGRVSGKGTSGGHTAETKRAAVEAVEVDRCKVYVDEEGFVCRTLDMGDAPRPVAYVKPATPPSKERAVRNTTGRKARSTTATPAPGGSGAGGRITDEDCISYIKAAAKGREIHVTKYMIAQARVILKNKQRAAAKQLKLGK